MSTDNAASELAKLLLKTPSREPSHLIQGVVQSVAAGGKLSVFISGSSFPVTGIRHLDSYHPEAGDLVWLVKSGPDLLCIGTLAPGIKPYCHAHRSGSNLPAPVGSTTVLWNAALNDTHNGLNTATGVYTFPETRLYTVSYGLRFSASTAGSNRQSQLNFNTNPYAVLKIGPGPTGYNSGFMTGSVTQRRTAGDTVLTVFTHDVAAGMTLETAGGGGGYMIIVGHD